MDWSVRWVVHDCKVTKTKGWTSVEVDRLHGVHTGFEVDLGGIRQ